MANVDFGSKDRNVSLNLTYGDKDVGFQIITPHGDLSTSLGVRTVEELRDSLDAWLKNRRKK